MPKTAFLFPGQGSQYSGMGKTLCQSDPKSLQLFEQASHVLGYDLLDVCANGPAEKLNATAISQPAIFVASLAALDHLESTEPTNKAEVVACAGLSLGEYTALVFAGALSFELGLEVVRARANAMQAASDATPSGMASIIGCEIGEVEFLVAACKDAGHIEIANYLCPGNIVVSGVLPAIERIEGLCLAKGGAKVARLAVAGAFHTSIMKPADAIVAEALEKIELRASTIPVWSNVDALPHSGPSEIRSKLVKQVISPVQWEQTLRNLLAEGIERFYEIGPGRVLAGLMKRVNRKVDFRNISA